MKKGVLKNFAIFIGKHLSESLFFNKVAGPPTSRNVQAVGLEACSFIKKDILTQVFRCEFCETFKNTFFIEHLWTTASIYNRLISN